MQSNYFNFFGSNRQFTSVNEQNNQPPPLDGHVIVNDCTINENINTTTTPGNDSTL